MLTKPKIFTALNLVAIGISSLFFYAMLQNPDYDDVWWPFAIYGALLSLPALLLGLTVAILNKTSQPIRQGCLATGMLNLGYGLTIFALNVNGNGPLTYYIYCTLFLIIGAYLVADNFAGQKNKSLKK